MGKPGPVITETNAPFFDACVKGEFVLQKCGRCQTLIYYPREVCPECLSRDLRWETARGTGVVETFTLVFRPENPVFSDSTPIPIVVVRLDEGPTIIAGYSGTESPEIGQTVEIDFVPRNTTAIPVFRPRK